MNNDVQQTISEQQKKAMEAWRKSVDDQIARMGSVYEEFAKSESKSVEQARTAIDEFAKVMKESLNYATQYAGEWRRLSLEATRRTAELMTKSS
jgi:hypothetical protein